MSSLRPVKFEKQRMNDYIFNSINKLINVGSGLLVAVILARFLDVEVRGELGFITNIAGLTAIVLGMGLSHAFIFRFRETNENQIFRQAVGLLIFQAVVFVVASIVAIGVVRSQFFGMLAALSVSLMLYQQLESIMAAYHIRLKMRVNIFYAVARLIAYVLMFTLADAGLWWPIVISIAMPLLAVSVYLAVGTKPRPVRPSLAIARRTFGFGWLPMLTTLLAVLNYNVDVVMLGLLGTEEDLGLYVVAAGIVTYLWVIPDAVKEVLVSRVVRERNMRTVLLPLKAAVVSALISAAAVAALGSFLIPILFGAEYGGSYPLVVVLSLGVGSMVYYKILGVVALAEGLRAMYFASLGGAVVLNILLNLWIIPSSGAVGAAWVSVITYTATGAAFVAIFCRRFGIPMVDVFAIRRSDLVVLRRTLGGAAR